MAPLVIYLHGFASGPDSAKARFFGQALTRRNQHVLIPDLNEPTFQDLTITNLLNLIDELVLAHGPAAPLILIGSSVGGLVAAIKSNDLPNLQAMVLLAPAFGMLQSWPTGIKRRVLPYWWRMWGTMKFHHEASGKKEKLKYPFYVDALHHTAKMPKVTVPTLVFHGLHDKKVPFRVSAEFAQANATARLIPLEDDHRLANSLPSIWSVCEEFLIELGLLPDAEQTAH